MLVERSQLSVEDVFALISERFDVYEHRPQQLELAHAINRTFTKKETGIFEAGTGTGKSLAALIPAILSGKRIVVSTATISLQEQYINKDIPALQALLPFEFKACLLKGRGNYLGKRRYQDHLIEEEIDSRLVDWMHTTETGDVSELDFMPPLDVWMEINSDGDDCLRNKCPRFNDCFYFEARRKAEKADILVVNHALLLADAASMGSVIPQYDYLIVDEAHHLPEIARDAFSASINNRGLRRLASRAYKKVNAPPELVHEVEVEGDQFFFNLAMQVPSLKARMRSAIKYGERFRESLGNLKKWLEEQEFEHIMDVDMARDKAKLKAKAITATVNNYIHCLELLENPDKDWVVWAERGDVTGSRFEVVAAPLKVAPFLQDLLIDKPGLESSVWMSATLATGGEDPFEFFKKSIGTTEHCIQDRVASPFDYRHQALLYLPNTLPEPNDRNYVTAAADEIERILRFSDGRAFVLFTSYSAMNTTYDLLKDRLPFDCQKQGDMPRKKLIEWFLSTYKSVLFGTSSFWEGVSVDGDQLSCVIIDRIPFQVPDDPVYEAQCEAIKDSGEGSWFNELALPYAIMRLKQGVGRLIRTKSDRGMVAILDPRLTRKQYGKLIIDCLPPFRVVRKLHGTAIDDMLVS